MKPKSVADYTTVALMLIMLGVILPPVFFQTHCGESSRTSSFSHLKMIGTALMMYVQDYDERLPPLPSVAAVQKRLYPYLKNEAAWREPKTGRTYQVNRALGGEKLAHFGQSAERVVVFYEALPDKRGGRAVAFLDGHVRWITNAKWNELKTRWKIPTTSGECLAALRAADERDRRLRLPVLDRRVNGWDALVLVVQIILPALFFRVFAPRRHRVRNG